jgi:hypothetical protein
VRVVGIEEEFGQVEVVVECTEEAMDVVEAVVGALQMVRSARSGAGTHVGASSEGNIVEKHVIPKSCKQPYAPVDREHHQQWHKCDEVNIVVGAGRGWWAESVVLLWMWVSWRCPYWLWRQCKRRWVLPRSTTSTLSHGTAFRTRGSGSIQSANSEGGDGLGADAGMQEGDDEEKDPD